MVNKMVGKAKSLQSKMKIVEKKFGITQQDKDRAVAVDYVIDTNRRGKNGYKTHEPRMVD